MKIDVSVELNVPYDDQAVSVLIEDATCRVKNRWEKLGYGVHSRKKVVRAL